MLSLLVSQKQTHRMLQLKHPFRGSSWSDLEYFQQCCQTPVTKTYCASGRTQQTRVGDVLAPTVSWTDWCRRDAQKGSLGQTVGWSVLGKPQTHVGLRPIPSTQDCTGRRGGQGWRETSHCTLDKHVGDEYIRTSPILNKKTYSFV